MGIGIPFRFSRLHGLFMQVLACSREVFMFVDNVFAADGMEGPVRFQIFPHVQIMEEALCVVNGRCAVRTSLEAQTHSMCIAY